MDLDKFDNAMKTLVDYAFDETMFDDDAYNIARLCLMDSLGCAIAASQDKDCINLLNSYRFSKNTNGIKIIGSDEQLGPIEAAFHIGSMIRWLEFNDTWLAQEWGHPSDNLGAILAAAAWKSQQDASPIRMKDVLTLMIRTYEIHGILCLTNCFNTLGIDHVVLVKVASSIAASKLLGLSKEQTLNALSNSLIDGHPLRTYRHAPNAGTRKSWAAGDATSRGLQFAIFAQTGEMGYPTALTAKKWGVNDSLLQGSDFNISRPLSDFVIKNILFKVPNPAEYHAQTAIEAALRIRDRMIQAGLSEKDIEYVRVETQRPAMQIIDKVGPLRNPADRDHCMQYMVAVALYSGNLTIQDFHEPMASNVDVQLLREKITCHERTQFTESYYDPDKMAIPNALSIKCINGKGEFYEQIEFPLGHINRRTECLPALKQKFCLNLSESHLTNKADILTEVITSSSKLDNMTINEFLSLFAVI